MITPLEGVIWFPVIVAEYPSKSRNQTCVMHCFGATFAVGAVVCPQRCGGAMQSVAGSIDVDSRFVT
jgi:hypothetical protein